MRTRVQGPKHFETVNAEWRLRRLRRVAPMPHEDRVAYQSADTMNGQATALVDQGKYAQAQPLFEKALEIRRRLLDRRPPRHRRQLQQPGGQPQRAGEVRARPSRSTRRRWRSTAACSPTTTPTPPPATTTWRTTSLPRGSTREAQPLFEKALEIRRRLLTDDHPDTANSYNNLATNLHDQGKYAQAQPLFEKALEIRRRLLTDDHPDTAVSYNNLAVNLNAQGKYAPGPAAVREGAGDPPPTAHRRPPRHRHQLQQPGGQPQRPGEVRRRPSRSSRRRWRSDRRLLTDDHPDTAASYNNLAVNLNAQGKYAPGPAALREGAGDPPPPAHRRPPRHRRELQQPGAQPQRPGEVRPGPAALREGAGDPPPTAHRRPPRHRRELQQPGAQPQRPGEVRRRPSRSSRRRWRSAADCSPTTTPTPPKATTTWRATSTPRGSTRQAQPLYEKALEINRRLLTDDHPDTATSYNNLAVQPRRPGEVRRRPSRLYEKALEIRRRLLTDDHPDTAPSYNNLAANLNAPGEVRARPSRCSRRRWRSTAACSPTTTPTPPRATTTWRPTSTPRGSTSRHATNGCVR